MLQTLSQPRTPRYMMHEQVNARPKIFGVSMLLLAMLALSVFFLKSFPAGPAAVPLAQQTLTLTSGQQVQLLLYANSRTNNHILQSRANILASALLQCPRTVWQQVYLSISHEKQIMNVTMKGIKNGHFMLRNLKASDVDRHMGFFNQKWLAGVDLCE